MYKPPCSAWEEKLALRRSDLSAQDQVALDAHVAECEACRMRQENYRLMDDALRALPQATMKTFPRFSVQLEAEDRSIELPAAPPQRRRSQAELAQRQRHARKRSWQRQTNRVLLGTMLTACVVIMVGLFGLLHMITSNHTSGTALLTFHKQNDYVSAIAWSPDGRYVATGSWNHSVMVWDARTGEVITTYNGHSEPVDSVAWSPNGQFIASGSWDHTVQVWQAFTGRLIHTYTGHSSEISSVAWSPDGQRIASGSWDHTVQIWQAFTGRPLLVYTGHQEFVDTVAWSPDGQEIASGGGIAR
ncbi:eIF2A-related protein [Dictyobacter kobayashii]|uniref:Uncharacterized protein n=1 Tax=Dictyobacter kobayashii TaxID=2014872 RepID=A0A402AQN2_9CHLR|nr:PD40 domain-containing protein [Dictyobacter kobayashii]GCE21360.1 hypothetical protein KDK_51600 [Dictyobacter kobayashii]